MATEIAPQVTTRAGVARGVAALEGYSVQVPQGTESGFDPQMGGMKMPAEQARNTIDIAQMYGRGQDMQGLVEIHMPNKMPQGAEQPPLDRAVTQKFSLKDYGLLTIEQPHSDQRVVENLRTAEWETIVKNPAVIEREKESEDTSPDQTEVQRVKQLYFDSVIQPEIESQKAEMEDSTKDELAEVNSETDTAAAEKIKFDARNAALEYDRDAEQVIKVTKAMEALQESVAPGEPLSQEDLDAVRVRLLSETLERKQTDVAVKEAALKAKNPAEEADAATSEDDQEYSDPITKGETNEKTSETQLDADTDVQVELADQPYLEFDEQQVEDPWINSQSEVEVTVQTEEGLAPIEESGDEQSLSVSQLSARQQAQLRQQIRQDLQDQLDEQPVIEPAYDNDSEADENRRRAAHNAAVDVFVAKENDPLPTVSGEEVTARMPDEKDPPEEVQSGVVKGRQRRDGSYEDVLARIGQIDPKSSPEEVDGEVSDAVEEFPAVKQRKMEEPPQREVTQEDVDRVLDTMPRVIRKKAA